MKYPVENVIDDIKKALSKNKKAVLQAPPGAGKTTIVPISLLSEPWLFNKKIIILEPRRIAARASAGRMAELLSEKVGKTVGYHISNDRCTGPETRIEVITEGILTRRIQNDPNLDDTGLIIFDEFHERNLNSDLGLAFSLECSEVFSETLRILVMSATIDTNIVSELMGGAPVIVSEGKQWPVDTRYVQINENSIMFQHKEMQYAQIIKNIVESEEGDVLVFLPGVKEIKNVEAALLKTIDSQSVLIIPLFGRLTKKEQDRAIFPSAGGFRKIVLSTSIAETSITIEGVSIVIDTGLMRVPKYYSGTGMSRLETVFVSTASAEQRRGRAGRTKPGICYRLWSRNKESGFKDYNVPEILNVDLTGFMLELSLWGVSDPEELRLLNYPPESSVKRARKNLRDLGAIDSFGKITSHGKVIAGLGIHPRLAHMIIKGKETGDAETACTIAALLGQRDLISFSDNRNESDIAIRLEILKTLNSNVRYNDKNIRVNMPLASQILKNAARYRKLISVKEDTIKPYNAGMLIAHAYPEWILQTRASKSGDYLTANGSGASLPESDYLAVHDYLVAAELDGRSLNSRIFLAAAYSKEQLVSSYGHTFQMVETVKWDKRSNSVVAFKELKYRKLVISKDSLKNADQDIVSDEMLYGIQEIGLNCLPWNRELRDFQARAMFLFNSGLYNDLPDISDESLLSSMTIWLKPFIHNIRAISQLKKLNLKNALYNFFDWQHLETIEKDAPTHITVPSGSKIRLKYFTQENGSEPSPILSVRLQELFGLKETPAVAGGRVPVTIHLLSPASKPVQVTKDLRSFWENTYFEVKKELNGRYPKHHWPDDPLSAMPTSKTKKAR